MFRTALWLVALAIAPVAHAQIDAPLPVPLDPKIESILAPLSGAPSIQRADEALIVELAHDYSFNPVDVPATLTPSFGPLRPNIAIGTPVSVQRNVLSTLWPGRSVDRLHYALPVDLLPDLYDLSLAVPTKGAVSQLDGQDTQRRAVAIVEDYPENPRVVIIADPSVGDPRPVQDAGLDALQRGETEQAVVFLERSLGNPMNAERWAAFARTVHDINLVRPDFVLVTGDLTFAVHPQALPYEYEDAWQLLDHLEVPAFMSPGNHDLYALDDYSGREFSEVDGKALWQLYFGPLYYSVDVGNDLHLVSLNTFDWPTLEPSPVWDEFDTLAGGQILAEQFAWLADDLRSYRADHPGGSIISFAHHDPSWIQNRHPWKGEGRLELRDLLAETGVGSHFSGHTHEDRVARYYQGDIVETNGRPHRGHTVRELHLIRRDNTFDQDTLSQAQMGEILHDPAHGPLFVSTTSAASQLAGDTWGLGGYWGWRLLTLRDINGLGGFDPVEFGYPASEEFLAERAERPENWNAAHAEFGLFSYPSYELSLTTLEGNDGSSRRSAVRIDSGLLGEIELSPRLNVAAEPGQTLRAEGGELLQVRYGDGIATARVRTRLPAQGSQTISLEALPGTRADDTATGRNTDMSAGGALSFGIMLILLTAARRRQTRN